MNYDNCDIHRSIASEILLFRIKELICAEVVVVQCVLLASSIQRTIYILLEVYFYQQFQFYKLEKYEVQL